jgi:hypothetical protein
MKPFILVAAVVAFELSFLASVASPPAPQPESVSAVQPQPAAGRTLARGAGSPAPVAPRG